MAETASVDRFPEIIPEVYTQESVERLRRRGIYIGAKRSWTLKEGARPPGVFRVIEIRQTLDGIMVGWERERGRKSRRKRGRR